MSLTDRLDGYEEQDWQRETDGTVRYALIGLSWWATDMAMTGIADT